MGAPDMRWLTMRAFTVRSWPDIASGSAGVENCMARFDPWASMITGAPASRASNGSVNASSGS